MKLKYFKHILISFFLFFTPFLLFYGCANQLPPGGGDIDRIPPRIISTFPIDKTTNFDKNYFELEFSEYVDKRTLKDAIFVSPPLDKMLDFNWSGTGVRISFNEKLKPNTTYSITVGTDLVDYNNRNRMDSSFTFAFSTGDQIDKGSISGFVFNYDNVFDSKNLSGTMIFAYRSDNISDADTIDPASLIPHYISQVGSNGYFNLNYLAIGYYKVFAVKDEFRDKVFSPRQDQIGIPFEIVKLSDYDSVFYNLNFFLNKIDTVPPALFSAVMTDLNHIMIKFSEDIDSSSFVTENFSIVDTNYNLIVKPKYFFKGRARENEYILSIDSALSENNIYKLITNNIKDKFNNIGLGDTITITVSSESDTLKPSLITVKSIISPIEYLNPSLSFYFDDGFNVYSLRNNISLVDTSGNKIPIDIKRIDDASFSILFLSKLKEETNYKVEFSMRHIVDIAGNTQGDTNYIYQFKTNSALDYSGLTGSIKGVRIEDNPIIVLLNKENSQIFYKKNLDSTLTFSFEPILPGTYKILCFLDSNNNRELDFGFPFPFLQSERFSFMREDIKVPARWSVNNVLFNFLEIVF